MTPDLFIWEAEHRLAEAEAEREAAHQRARLAPHGEVVIRRQRFAEATARALEIGRELLRMRRGAR